jgi:hypothetical protein
MSYNTSQHCCFVSDALASPLQALHKSFSASQDASCDIPPFSMGQLSKWRVSAISEWQSNCTKLPPSRKTAIGHNHEDSNSTCRCSATHLCGTYLVVELNRACGCLQSVQVRVNAYSERFVLLDGVAVTFPVEGNLRFEGTDSSSEDDSSVDDSSVDWLSTSTHLSDNDSLVSSPFFSRQASDPESPLSSGPNSPSESADFFVKCFQFPAISKRFSLVDLALILNAVQQEHADHRWTDSYADRSLIEFTTAEVFAFLVYFLELDWRNQVLEYRRSIAKRFYDKRVMAWNTVSLSDMTYRDLFILDAIQWISSSSRKLIPDGDLLSSPFFSPPQIVGQDDLEKSQNQVQELDHERRLLSCMKDRVSFVSDELRLLWMSLAAQKCALQASKMYLDEGEC